MTGRERCDFLRNIRKNIAEMNGLDYEPHECTHEGWCPGYCPACDAESADLMRQLEKKEASGSPIRIDTEGIKFLEEMAKDTCLDEDEEDVNDEVMGNMVSPLIEGDIIEEELMGAMPAPPRDDDDILPPEGGLPEFEPERRFPLIPPQPEALKTLEEKGIIEDKYKICSLCQDCERFNTITVIDGVATRCAALSDHFFNESVAKGICWIKKHKTNNL